MSRQYIFLFLITWCLLSCDQRTSPVSDQYYSLKITNSSGDDFSYTKQDSTVFFAPYPFNVGKYKLGVSSREVMLISKRVDRGEKVDILPIAKLTLTLADRTNQDIVIAVPEEENLRIIESRDFYDFTVGQFSLKQIVEYWYSNRHGLQGTSVKGWSPASMEDLKDI